MRAHRTYRKAFIARLRNKRLGELEVAVVDGEMITDDLSELQEWYGWYKHYGIDMYELVE